MIKYYNKEELKGLNTMTEQTPMMKQYLSIKSEYEDCLLFFRLGDFYEMFFDDAKIASKELEITLTARDAKKENPIPMCGVPHHSANGYIKTLLDRGYKIAICEQMEDAKAVKGMVRREVVKVLTPGTAMDDYAIDNDEHHYVLCIDMVKDYYTLAYVDVTTGDCYFTQFDQNNQTLISEVMMINPKEIVVSDSTLQLIPEMLKGQYIIQIHHQLNPLDDIVQFEISDSLKQQSVVQKLFNYIYSHQRHSLTHIKDIEEYALSKYMQMDSSVVMNLELHESISTKKKKGSLFHLMDYTMTPMGRRLLKKWIDKPLISQNDIEKRQMKVHQFIEQFIERDELREMLTGIYDIDRLASRIAFNNANPKDIKQLEQSLLNVQNCLTWMLEHFNISFNVDIESTLQRLTDVFNLIDGAIVDNPPNQYTEGRLFNVGYDESLDELRDISMNAEDWLLNYQQQQRNDTGIKSLKVNYNKVFGYYIEISKAQLHSFDESHFGYQRRQTLTNAERFITDELKEKEQQIESAKEKSHQLEYELFIELRSTLNEHIQSLQQIALLMSEIDVLQSMAELASQHHYVRPTFSKDKTLTLRNARHPIVEAVMNVEDYVPNDCNMNDQDYIALLTGPNMSGKSTYMRQVGIISIMAQMGSYVPADEAVLPIFDKIFTRIGASDDLAGGKSTFMVEMMEASVALTEATENSLIIFDEIGRGTSTYDGMALAKSMLEYIAKHIHAKTFFSTHYHELTELEESLKPLFNIHVTAKQQNGQLYFLHKVMPGAVKKSYGIEVAKLAELPNEVIQRATTILSELESQQSTNIQKSSQRQDGTSIELRTGSQSKVEKHVSEKVDEEQLSFSTLFDTEQVDMTKANKIIDMIEQFNLIEKTPLEAMNFIQSLKSSLKEE